jgi:hypothetical protein
LAARILRLPISRAIVFSTITEEVIFNNTSLKKFKSKLKEDPEFTQVFMQESFAALEALIKPIKQESEEEFVDTTSIMLKMMREQMAA